MSEIVKLTQEQATAIEYLRGTKFSDVSIISSHARSPIGWEANYTEPLNGLSLLILVDALRIGYEVEPEYKYGDWVTKHYSDLSYLIGNVNQVRNDGMVSVICSGGNTVFIPYEELSASTSEEIKTEKERRLWSGIGREVGEFKPDDIGITKDNNTHYRNKPAMLTGLYKSGRLQGFYPAESFVSFVDDIS